MADALATSTDNVSLSFGLWADNFLLYTSIET